MKAAFKWSNFLQGGILLYAGGLFFVYRVVLVASMALSQSAWPATSALVSESEKNETRTGNGRVEVYYAFEYRYQVGDKEYKSSTYAANQLSLSPREGVQRFKVGERIRIFYNPKQPAEAVVEKKPPSAFAYLGFLLGVTFLLMATGLTFFGEVGGLVYYFEDRRRAKELAFGKRYQSLSDEAFLAQIAQINEEMPKSLKKIVAHYTQGRSELSHISTLLARYTQWEPARATLFLEKLKAMQQ